MALRHDIANAPTWAMFVAPHVGGIFSFYRGLRRALRDRVRSVELDGDESRWREYDPTLAGPEHTILLLDGCDAQAAGRRVARWLDEAGIQVVLVTAMTPAIVHDAIPHLPRNIRVIARLTEISQHSYRSALRHAQALDGVFVQCTRQAKDIAAIAPDLPQHRLSNAVDTDRFNSDAQGIAPEAPLRLLFLDRLVDLQKRVFLLPEICRALDATDIAYTLTVAGDGPDAAQLRQRLARWITDGRVTMPGAIAGADVPDVIRAHDIYLKLSRNEGSPNAVLEALASGLVTIAFDIPGVIDDVLRDGRSGYIAPSGDTRAVVDRIGRLDADRGRLRTMAQQARTAAVESHSIDRFAERVAQIEAALPELSRREPKPWSDWTSSEPKPSSLRRHLRRALPLGWRIRAREWLGRLR